MAVGIVHRFEVVYVKHDQAGVVTITTVAFVFGVDQVFPGTTVEQTGQAVGHAQLGQLFVGGFQCPFAGGDVGDVVDHQADFLDLAVWPGERADGQILVHEVFRAGYRARVAKAEQVRALFPGGECPGV